jgi:hypothetical protein
MSEQIAIWQSTKNLKEVDLCGYLRTIDKFKGFSYSNWNYASWWSWEKKNIYPFP